MKIDPGTQSGKTLRLKGKGLPSLEGYGQGDQLIHVAVWTPKSLTNEEKEVLEKLKQSDRFQPRPGAGDKSFFDKVKDLFQG
jgi:molecular chaperone DnaJ